MRRTALILAAAGCLALPVAASAHVEVSSTSPAAGAIRVAVARQRCR